jgi:UDP-N-acetylmuramoyl-tripeptide--D-alanyl-D-alanine ligase
MPIFPPGQLAAWSRGRWTALPATPITGFTNDTRTLQPGQLFVALKTDRRDGHEFLAAAQAAGAAGALVGRAHPALALPQLVVADPLGAFQLIAREHRRLFPGPVVGITGSVGKTSTKDLLALLLGDAPADAAAPEGASPVLATEGTLNNHIGVPLTLTRLDPARHRFAVIEAGVSAPGEMRPLAGMIEPDLAIITLIAPAHLQGLGDVEAVAREKAALPAAVRPAGIAVFPRPCLQFDAFRDLSVRTLTIEAAEVVRPAEPPQDKVFFAITQRGDATALAIAYGPPPPLHFTMRRVSAGMAQNAVLAICAALWLGVAPGVIQERLAAWQPAKWRGEQRREPGRLLYLDCYNANPASMADALDNFASLASAGEPRVYVLGCMEELGPPAAEYHRRLGRTMHLRPGDRLFVIGDQAGALRAGLLENGNAADQIEIVADLAPVAAFLAGFQGAVFLKGSRRHQLEKALLAAAPPETVAC